MEISEIVLAVAFVAALYVIAKHTILYPPLGRFVETIPNFLTHTECDSLIDAAAKTGYERSEVSGSVEPAYLDLDSRKSDQTWFSPGKHAISDKIRQKTKDFVESKGLFEYDFEDLQIAKYGKNGYYKHHFDGDECEDSCPLNQRLCTMIVYLKEPKSGGGETDFPKLGISIQPKKGDAVFFWVANPTTRQLYEETLHAGMPVKAGEKIIATQWIRAKSASS
ncbi:prolyl 4-hydroxylase [Paramecium bursaria Chlorella virus NE-JV-1]|nr:prolyl 4-hydroxylase [Paramecium bursaria Chlorella virus NE-JV-1]